MTTTCPICGLAPTGEGTPCCTREYAKGVVRAADRTIAGLRRELAKLPSPEAIEAAKDALREGAHACMMQGAHVQADAMRAALAKLEGRS